MNSHELIDAVGAVSEHVDRLLLIVRALEHDTARLDAERARIAALLATFHAAPVSLSSLQPILALAEELTPSLREPKVTP